MSDSIPINCPFCQLPPERVLDGNAHAVTVADAFPVSPGHMLVIVRRHIASFFEMTDEEVAAVYQLLRQAKLRSDATLKPYGYNIGVNDGAAAGQTVMHLHFHLIPRFAGDVSDPRGGVRRVIPDKGSYP
jgi:diadenosine tetraphosphate (Ap4A) HIT family hydrolase